MYTQITLRAVDFTDFFTNESTFCINGQVSVFPLDALKERFDLNDRSHNGEAWIERIDEATNEMNEPHIIRVMYGKFIIRAEKYVEVGRDYVEI